MAGTWLERTMQRGRWADHFPHQLWFIMDNPLRRLWCIHGSSSTAWSSAAPRTSSKWGPGPGLFSVELARRLTSGRLELLELQPEMLVRARRKLDRAGCSNVGFHAGDAGGRPSVPRRLLRRRLPRRGARRRDRQPACLRSLARVLRPGGLLVVEEFFPDPDRMRVPEIRGLAEPAGFRLVGAQGRPWNYTVRFRRG